MILYRVGIMLDMNLVVWVWYWWEEIFLKFVKGLVGKSVNEFRVLWKVFNIVY